MNITKYKTWTWQSTKQTWTYWNWQIQKWTAILRQNTKQIWTLLNTKNWTWRNTQQTCPIKPINTKSWTTILSWSTKQTYWIQKLIMTEHKTNMNITKYKTWTLQNTKLTWTWLKNWAALLRQNTKQNTTTLWWIKQ